MTKTWWLLIFASFIWRSNALAEIKAPGFKLLSQQEFKSDLHFQKTRVGGLSGLVYDKTESLFWAVSDDRGKFGEPRIYALRLEAGAKPSLKLEKLLFLKDPKKKLRVYDFEGVTLLPWGNLLVSSEGDMNKKPRVQPALIEFKKKNGEWVRDYDLPSDYLAEASGRQTKGVRNNFAFEGMGWDGATTWLAATELPLVQDKNAFARVLEIHQPVAWVLKTGREWLYPLAELEMATKLSGKDFNVSLTGVSEIQFVRDHSWWVLERAANLSIHGLGFSAQIHEVRLPEIAPADRKLVKSLVLDLDPFAKANFEAMAWGPDLPNGKRLLLVMSDNNFDAGEPTRILFFEVDFEHMETKKGS